MGRKSSNSGKDKVYDCDDSKDDKDELSDVSQLSYIAEFDQYISKDNKKDLLSYCRHGAIQIFSRSQLVILSVFLSISLCYLYFYPQEFLFFFLLIANTLCVFLGLFKIWTFIKGKKTLKKSSMMRELKRINTKSKRFIKSDSFPYYTILLPMYNEPGVVNNLIKAIDNIIYPKNKLQVLLIIEECDTETMRAIDSALPKHFEIIIVPDFDPKTKAKACNYALRFVYGEYLVIFDADDIPAKDQLIKAVNIFRASDKQVVCLQAKLNYYNIYENFLSSMFAIEYSILFDYVVPGLLYDDMPILLGGSSNHFKTSILKELKGWDIFNVTEDADIGLLIKFSKFKIKLLDSYTFEEATVTIKNWFFQRVRWIKGHIHTYLVHIRKPIETAKKLVTFKNLMCFNMLLCITNLVLLMLPWSIGITIFQLFGFLEFSNAKYCVIINYITLYNTLTWFITILWQVNVVIKTHNMPIHLWWLYPVYLLMHPFAALYALYSLLKSPHYWNKTLHGVTKHLRLKT